MLIKGISVIFETKDWNLLKKEWNKETSENIKTYLTKEGKELNKKI